MWEVNNDHSEGEYHPSFSSKEKAMDYIERQPYSSRSGYNVTHHGSTSSYDDMQREDD